MVGGASKPCAMVVRDGTAWGVEVYNLQLIVYCLELIVYSLQLISREFADNLQISFGFLGGFEKKAYFCGNKHKMQKYER